MAIRKEDYDFFERTTDIEDIINLITEEEVEADKMLKDDLDIYLHDKTLEEFTDLLQQCRVLYEAEVENDAQDILIGLGFQAVCTLYLTTLNDRYNKFKLIKENE